VEHVPADWAKVLAIVQDALTQTRSKVSQSVSILILTHLSKIAWSLKVNKSDELRAPLAQHKNIYQAIVKGSQCSINVVLCARIAVMVCLQCQCRLDLSFFQRAVYLEHPGAKFWDEIDKRLARIRRMGGNDAKKITKYGTLNIHEPVTY
jgi:hypothetical protein